MIATTANVLAMMRITATTDPPMMAAVEEDDLLLTVGKE